MEKNDQPKVFSTRPKFKKWPTCTCGCCKMDYTTAKENDIAKMRYECICKYFPEFESFLIDVLMMIPKPVAAHYLGSDLPDFVKEQINEILSKTQDSEHASVTESCISDQLSNIASPYQLEFVVALLESTRCFFDDLSFMLAMRNLSSIEKQTILSKATSTTINMDELNLNTALNNLVENQQGGQVFQLILDALTEKRDEKKKGRAI